MSSSHKDKLWDLRHTADLSHNIDCDGGDDGDDDSDDGGDGDDGEGNITVILRRGEHHKSVTPTIIPGEEDDEGLPVVLSSECVL